MKRNEIIVLGKKYSDLMANEGMSITEITAREGVCRTTVYDRINTYRESELDDAFVKVEQINEFEPVICSGSISIEYHGAHIQADESNLALILKALREC